MSEGDLVDPNDPGSVEYVRPADLPAVEVLMAENSVRRWVWLHHTYTVCTVQAIAHPVPWRYRRRRFDLGADGVSLMEPGEVHLNLKVSDPATFRVLFIDPGAIDKAAAELGVGGAVHFGISQVDGGSHPELRSALLALHGSLEHAATPLERESLFHRCLELLFEECVERPAPRSVPRSDPPTVLRARDYIEEHLTEPVRLQDVVDAAGATSRFQLLRAFAAATGLPPHAYQIQRRIVRGKTLLAEAMPPGEVASELGFVDQSHFTRHFKRVVGVPPAAYQREIGARKNVQDSGERVL